MNAQADKLRDQLERYRGFLRQDGTNLQLLIEIADLHLQLGEFAEARRTLQEALVHHAGNQVVQGRLASVAIASNQPEEAIDLLQGLMQAGTDNPVLRYNLAYALLLAGRYADAKEILLPVFAAPKAPEEAPKLLARIFYFLGEMDKALEHIQTYLAKHPQDNEAMGLMAMLHLDTENNALAKETAEKTLATDPHNIYGLVTMGSLALNEQDDETAQRYFEDATQRYPKSGRAWSGMGLTSMLQMDLPRALEQLKLAVQHMPTHIGTWHTLGWCQLLMNDLTGAEASFRKTMDLDRTFDETHGGLAVVLISQQRFDEAERHVSRALRLNPQSFSGRFAQSLLISRSNPAQAQAKIQEILGSVQTLGGESLQRALTRAATRTTKSSTTPSSNH